jgi:prepilin-type N-terminal cleavage/methylation domain-containing protein
LVRSRGGDKFPVARRRGFTLVEVIVVLVILAILAAIAIPALTGYIDKAEDKKYIADARNAIVAYRALIEEDYANGTLGNGLPSSGPWSTYLSDGNVLPSYTQPNLKEFAASHLSVIYNGYTPAYGYITGPMRVRYTNGVANLLGFPNVTGSDEPGYFGMSLLAPKVPPSYTILNAPAFMYFYYPEGAHRNKPMDIVTYNIGGLDGEYNNHYTEWSAMFNLAYYDPNVGYKVFHVTRDDLP